MSCVPLSCLVLSCAGFCRFGLLLTWLVLSSSSVVSSCRVLSSLVLVPARSGGFLKASWAPLEGPLGASGSPPGADFGPLDGLGPSRAIPGPLLGLPWALLGGPGRLPGPLLAALGCSWASLGPPWGAPGGSLRRSWRLPGGSWGPLGGLKVAFCRKAEFRRQYSVFHGFWGVREPPGASWGSLGALVAAPGALLAALGLP